MKNILKVVCRNINGARVSSILEIQHLGKINSIHTVDKVEITLSNLGGSTLSSAEAILAQGFM